MSGATREGVGPGELPDEIPEVEDLDTEGGIDEGEIDEADGEGDGVADGGDEEEGQTRDVARGGRGRDTIKQLRVRAQEAERARDAERQEFQRRLTEIETRQRAPQQISPEEQARRQAEEQARLEMMTPAEVARYFAEQTERRVAAAVGSIQFQTADQIDRQAFEAEARSNPLLRPIKDKVESLLQQERAQGRNTNRLIVAKYVLGDELMTRHSQRAPQQRRAANGRVQRQTTTPANGGGDARREGGRQGDDSYEAALRRVRGVSL